MEQIFLWNINNDLGLDNFLEEYTSSAAFEFVQQEVIAINWSSPLLQDKMNKANTVMRRINNRLTTIVAQMSIEDRFRLLIIGQSGDIKKMLLEKVSHGHVFVC